MDAKQALQERTELFDNAFAFKHNKHTPSMSNFWTWKYLDAGYNLNDVLRDYDMLEQANRSFHELYQFDCYMDKGTRNPIRVSEAFGARFHYIDESGEFVLADDRCLIEAEEYPELSADSQRFYWEKAFPRYVKPGLTLAEFKAGVQEFLAFGEFAGKMDDIFLNEYGTLSPTPANTFATTPFENLFNFLRGIKELALDVRKHRAELLEVSELLWLSSGEPVLQQALATDGYGAFAHVGLAFLAHSILSHSQFEELYWPYVKRVIDAAAAANKRVFVFCESEMLRFADFFEDVPKGVVLIHPEQDDIFEFRRRLPNIVLAGGMPASLLGGGTKAECVDYAKRLIDELGEGFVFSTNKMMSYRNDAKRENLLAVMDFVRSYEP